MQEIQISLSMKITAVGVIKILIYYVKYNTAMNDKLEKFGTFGAIITAAACPVCFPKISTSWRIVWVWGFWPHMQLHFLWRSAPCAAASSRTRYIL